MAYDVQLTDRVRAYLVQFPELEIEEKRMFGGLAFMVNTKMCINVSGDNLMCRFDPSKIEEIAEKIGFYPMIMRGKEYRGYCYVEPIGFEKKEDFEFWINLCLDFNKRAKASVKKKKYKPLIPILSLFGFNSARGILIAIKNLRESMKKVIKFLSLLHGIS